MNIFYFIKEALRGFYQAKIMTFISVVTIGLTLFFLGCVAVGYLNIKQWLASAGTRVDATVFIADSTAADSASFAQLVSQVKKLPQVAAATVIDKSEAWNRFRQENGDQMLAAVDENPFPASIDLTFRAQSQTALGLEAFKKDVSQIKGVEDVKILQQWVVLLQKFRNYFLIATVCVSIVLFVALYFMIANTIKLTIYGRKELVRNMHFVGATDLYIKMPFILEGILQGFIGSGIGVAALYIVKMSLTRFPVFFGPWFLFLLLFPIGVLFGCIGSMSAVRKFLVS